MIEIKGKFNTAVCFTNKLEPTAYSQIESVCNEKAFAGSKIRIMPDVHAGMGCTIGTTMTITDKIVPGMVGVDIGCGMETIKIEQKQIDFQMLDEVIRQNIPCGREICDEVHKYVNLVDIDNLYCNSHVSIQKGKRSIGTLGGGNHFIEIDKDDEENLYLVIHSGSRHLGREVAEYYKDQAIRSFWGGAKYQIDETIQQLKAERRYTEIEKTIKELKRMHEIDIPKDLAYLTGVLFDEYIHDMKIMQNFASVNRKAIADTIITKMGFTVGDSFTTIHNYIDTDAMILRKGAVSAKKGELLLIPVNMRDGSLICIGKGNEEWNMSAPHGAGRIMSRKKAFHELTLEEYEKQMKGIFSTCVGFETLDESPMAYKNMDEIVANIEPTAEIVRRIVPVYNFKAGE